MRMNIRHMRNSGAYASLDFGAISCVVHVQSSPKHPEYDGGAHESGLNQDIIATFSALRRKSGLFFKSLSRSCFYGLELFHEQ